MGGPKGKKKEGGGVVGLPPCGKGNGKKGAIRTNKVSFQENTHSRGRIQLGKEERTHHAISKGRQDL